LTDIIPPNPASTKAPPNLPPEQKDGAFKVSDHHTKTVAVAKSARDEDLAVEIMKLAVESHKTHPGDTELVNTCERLWRWAIGETHPLPEDKA
jgi:hypothetical protein